MDLRGLIARLDGLCTETLEEGVALCLSRSHYNVELEHWFLKILDRDSDAARLLQAEGVSHRIVKDDLNRAIDSLKTGNGRSPSLSPQLVKAVREAWLLCSLDGRAPEVRSGHLLLAILNDPELSAILKESSPQFAKLNVASLLERLESVTAGSLEAPADGADPAPLESPAAAPGAPAPANAALAKFCIDLTERARRGEIDPVLGRDPEIRQVVDILTRRRQNNPILTGEAGVGKTAVVEGFALKIVAGDVPEALRAVRLLSLDLGLLQAGAGVKGEFENR